MNFKKLSTLLTFSLCAALLWSCEEEEVPQAENKLIQGNWRVVAHEANIKDFTGQNVPEWYKFLQKNYKVLGGDSLYWVIEKDGQLKAKDPYIARSVTIMSNTGIGGLPAPRPVFEVKLGWELRGSEFIIKNSWKQSYLVDKLSQDSLVMQKVNPQPEQSFGGDAYTETVRLARIKE